MWNYLKQKKPSISEHLASLSVQYEVYPAELFNALVAARGKGKVNCENLSVEYRGSVDNEAIFLIKLGQKVIVQFRVDEEILRQIAKQNPATPVSIHIQDLRHGMKKVNLTAEVVETQKPRQVNTQFGNVVMMTNAFLSDGTGKIKLLLWDQQVNSVAVGDTVEIKNASISTFRGEKQIRLGKTGTLTVTKSGESKAKQPDSDKEKKVICA